MESTGETWLTVLQHQAQRLIPTRWMMPPIVKRREIRCSSVSRRGALRNVMRSIFFFFLYQQRVFYSIVPQKFFSNCKFTRSFLMSAIWQGSPCRRSSDDANTDWVHCLSPRCTVKWQTELPAISSQRRRDVGCATATVATDANVVTMSPDVALLAGRSPYVPLSLKWYSQSDHQKILVSPWSVLDIEPHGLKTLDIAPKCGRIFHIYNWCNYLSILAFD